MPTDLHMTRPAHDARRILVAAGVLALAMLVPAGRLAAQAPSAITFPDTLRVHEVPSLGSALAPSGCLSLRIVPGDTVGRAMPRASGDSLADSRMPRGSGLRPPCDRVRAAAPAVAQRLFRMPDGTYRAIPAPKASVPPRR